jgi:hypothetical protein
MYRSDIKIRGTNGTIVHAAINIMNDFRFSSTLSWVSSSVIFKIQLLPIAILTDIL